MKILYLSNQRLPTEKAYGLQISKMCEAFADWGHEVELLIPTRRNYIKEDLFEYYSVRRNFKVTKALAPDFYLPGKLDRIAFEIKMFFSAFLLAWRAWLGKYDLIYSRDEWPLWFLSFCRKNILFEAHKFSKVKKIIYPRLRKNKLVVISEGLRREFERTGFQNVLIAPDGVDLEEFAVDISQTEARKKVSLPLDRQIVMYTGHLYDWKGVDILIEAVKYFPENCLLVLVGGTAEDLQNYAHKIKEQGLEKNIFLLGQWPHKMIPFFLKAADVLVLPNKSGDRVSESYTSPLKLFEYMSSGRPMVASNLPSLREILNEQNAVLVNPNDPQALADGTKKLLNEPASGEGIARQALQDVQQYSWSQRAERIFQFLKR